MKRIFRFTKPDRKNFFVIARGSVQEGVPLLEVALRLPESRHNRILSAQWGNHHNVRSDVDIEVEAHDRQGLLRDISDLFAREKVNAIKANTMTRNNLALMQFSIEISSLEQLSRLLALIQHVPNVIAARRRD